MHSLKTLCSQPRHRSASIRTVECRLQGADGYAAGASHVRNGKRVAESFPHQPLGTSDMDRPSFLRWAQQLLRACMWLVQEQGSNNEFFEFGMETGQLRPLMSVLRSVCQ